MIAARSFVFVGPRVLFVSENSSRRGRRRQSTAARVRKLRPVGSWHRKSLRAGQHATRSTTPSVPVFCDISSSKAICRGTGWSTPSRTTRRTSRTMTGPPSSRPWGASSSSWLQPSGRDWPTRHESLGAPSMTVSPGFLPSIDVLPLARRNLTVAWAFFWLSAALTRRKDSNISIDQLLTIDFSRMPKVVPRTMWRHIRKQARGRREGESWQHGGTCLLEPAAMGRA